MAFIAINAKADMPNTKKGKLTPAQNAQLNAFCLTKKTGIFNVLGRCIASANTPVNNKSVITFQNGYIAIYGRLVECESNTQFELSTPISGQASGRIVLRFTLSASGESEFKIMQVPSTETLNQQDLNELPHTGTYDFALYAYTATPTEVTLTRDDDIYIESVEDTISQILAGLREGTRIVKKSYIAQYASEDYSKGTIEERLTSLGFKKGAITFCGTEYSPDANDWTTATQGFFRQGNYVLAKFLKSNLQKNLSNSMNLGSTNALIGRVPEQFRPKNPCFGTLWCNTGTNFQDVISKAACFFLHINTDGNVMLVNSSSDTATAVYRSFCLNIAYEASPL